MSELVQLKFDKIMRSKTYSCIVLDADSKKFAIYTDLPSGKSMQMYLTETARARPSTHDLMSMVYRGLDIRIKQVVISDLQDTTYYARLFLEQKCADITQIVEIDARPSDCITLALIQRAPIYCTRDVLEKVIAMVEE